ncbi:unnamed protein product [Sphagnum troendelagicum]|uniref:RCC1-like domain-containing protein n=1 Tax=Sphagnum troendelagicum TaxID=128251 RepID=A0ABP0U6S0_9BRYO
MRGSEVWSWGAGTHGQLASGSDCDAFTPHLVCALSGKDVVQIACGGAHAVAVLGNGEAMTWGRGLSGALGHGNESSWNLPNPVKSLQGIKISIAAAGWNHTAFVTESGGLYTCGDGTFGQLGLGDTQTRFLPCLVEHLTSLFVTMVACGMRHTLALVQGPSEETAVYAFGSNRRGQLGIEIPQQPQTKGTKNVVCISKPQSITTLNSKKLVAISANGDHSAALTVTGQLYLWGRGFCNNRDMSIPCAAALGVEICQVSLGWSHGLAISGASLSLSLISANVCIALSQEVFSERFLCLPKVGKLGMRALVVAAGSEHSAAVFEDGEVMVWGWAEHGQLGLSTTENQNIPQRVVLESKGVPSDPCSMVGSQTNDGINIQTLIQCGSGFTFLLQIPCSREYTNSRNQG